MRPLSFATALLLASAAHATPGTFAARDLTVNERSGVAIANVCRVGGTGTSKVTIQTAGVTAKAGTDYVAISKSLTFTIPMCLPVAITIINDAVHEPTETFQIILSAVSNAAITRARGTITILDDDPAPTPPPNQWVAAPLQDGTFARVKANDSTWDITGPGAGRQLIPGEIVAVYFNGWGVQADGGTSFAIYALGDGTSGRALASDLEGVAPVGSPPGLPADWWVPGLVTANKTCTDPRQGHEGQPGVTQEGTYRAAMVAGSHMKLASGVAGSSGSMWQVFGSGDQNSPVSATFTVAMGDCLTGQ